MEPQPWDAFRQACMKLDPYLTTEYSAEVYAAWESGKDPAEAIHAASEICRQFEEW